MKCHTPDCTGEREAQPISHSVIYRRRTVVVHGVPADLCPACGDAVVTAETLFVLDSLLRRKARGKRTAFAYE
jgi:YgiT-type zinc finger domain-containing protein